MLYTTQVTPSLHPYLTSGVHNDINLRVRLRDHWEEQFLSQNEEKMRMIYSTDHSSIPSLSVLKLQHVPPSINLWPAHCEAIQQPVEELERQFTSTLKSHKEWEQGEQIT